MSLRALLIEACLDAWALVMPVECAGCGLDDRALCPSCRSELEAAPTVHSLADGTRVVAGLRYSGVLRRVILAYKEHQRTDVAAALARPLEAAITLTAVLEAAELPPTRSAAPARPLELIAIPTSRAAWRRRGYDPVALLARRARFRAVRGLRQVRSSTVQKALDVEGRRANRAGSLVGSATLAGRRFVVVDDVLTTGATLEEAVRAITAAGGEVVAAACLAFTPRLFGAAAGNSANSPESSVTLSANETTVGEKARKF